jgi:hypothetical protein
LNALKWAKAITHNRRCVTKVRKSSEKETRKRLQYHVHWVVDERGSKDNEYTKNHKINVRTNEGKNYGLNNSKFMTYILHNPALIKGSTFRGKKCRRSHNCHTVIIAANAL